VLTWLKEQTITETKGVFKDLTATVNGFTFVFGLGGIHGSVEREKVVSDDTHVIESRDVTSYYPNLAIKNRFYPAHLGEKFCDIYADLFEQRKKYPKKSSESATLKLALNGTYGDSNNKFSVFYDPLFTMRITLNGQLLLCMLAETVDEGADTETAHDQHRWSGVHSHRDYAEVADGCLSGVGAVDQSVPRRHSVQPDVDQGCEQLHCGE
jgi:hypothetical protein